VPDKHRYEAECGHCQKHPGDAWSGKQACSERHRHEGTRHDDIEIYTPGMRKKIAQRAAQ